MFLKSAERTMATSNFVDMLFTMKIDSSVSTTPSANVRTVSYYQEEEEEEKILFFIYSVFRIGQVEQTDENRHLWQADLMRASDNDP